MKRHAGPPEGAEFEGPTVTIGLDPKFLAQAKKAAVDYAAKQLARDIVSAITEQEKQAMEQEITAALKASCDVVDQVRAKIIETISNEIADHVTAAVERAFDCGCSY